jgi:rSAM/selenodomain-associated transferase 1
MARGTLILFRNNLWKSNFRMSKPTVCLMLKAPNAGKVKTRLAESIGSTEACRIYQLMVDYLWNQVKEWPCEIHFSPPESLPLMRSWLGETAVYILQPEGDLGDRLRFAMQGAFDRGASSVFLIGGDCLEVTAAVLDEAEKLLQSHAVVIGPATDGGYYLIGMKSPQDRLFEEIEWSTETVFHRTMERVKERGLSCAILPTFSDVDDLASLESARVQHEFLR